MLWWPLLIERYTPNLAIELNKQEKIYKESVDMFEVINKDQKVEELNIPSTNNIIISTPEDTNIKRNVDGTFSILLNSDINVTGSRLLINSLAVLELTFKLNISVPKGIILNFDSPLGSMYHNRIYSYYNLIERKNQETNLPQNIIYHNFKFIVYLDLDQFKRINNIMLLKKNTDIIRMYFTPIYFIGSTEFPNIDYTYWVQHNEIYRTFADMF